MIDSRKQFKDSCGEGAHWRCRSENVDKNAQRVYAMFAWPREVYSSCGSKCKISVCKLSYGAPVLSSQL